MTRTALALVLFLGASVANAAGLGKLTVNSALGQVLNAEIDLVSVQPGELDALTARVAPPEAFRDARIEYSSSLRLLRFSVEKRANGQPYLKVTSVAPINEPFVDALIEVTWPAGRIQREYPILLDPPGYSAQRAAPPTVAAAPASRAPDTPPATAPAASSASPVSPSTSAPTTGTGAPSAQAELASTPPGAPRDSGTDTYGPVEKGDTLRKIAEETKPASVSLEQMLVALYRENKTAFVGNNMNRLRTGQILKVPSAEEVEKVTKREAGTEIRTHVADWKAYREQVAGSVPAAPTTRTETNVATGRVGSAAVAPPPAPQADSSKDVLKLSKTDASGKAGVAGKGAAASADRLNAMQEELTAKDKALREAQSRVSDLEKQIRDMQRLLDLKGGAPGKAEAPKVAVVPPAPTKAEPPKAVEPPKTEPPKTEPVKPLEPFKPFDPPKADTKPGDAKPGDTKVAEAPKPSDPAKVAEAPKQPTPPKADAPKVDATKAPPKKAAPPPKSFTDDLLDNSWIIAAGLGGLAALGLGAFLFMRRRNRADDAGMNSNMTSAFPSDLKADNTTGRAGAGGGGLVDTGNSSFLTDFDKTGPGTIDTDEVDPVAEAEVYIAYGRDAQAEEILKEAMARDRNRHEISLKLLEIYHARKSATAFETVAKELRAAVGDSHPLWQKAAAMGAQIDPSNPLYVGAAAGTATYTAMSPAAAAPAQAKPNLDFDLDGSSGGGGGAAPAPDFDLDLDSRKAGEAHKPASSGLDFDIESSTSMKPTPMPAPAPEEKPSFDFDLSGLDFPSSKSAPSDLDLDTKSNKGGTMDMADLSLDSGGGEGGEAVGTKLELAKAYLEIGDKDGAREILQEVAKEGSSAQREEAQKLISQL